MYAYLDETFGGANNDLTAVAGYLFDDDGLTGFRKRYHDDIEPLLPTDKKGRRIFHAAPCFSGDGPFAALPREVRKCILGRMAAAIRQSVTFGVIVGVENAAYADGVRGRYMGLRIGGRNVSDLSPWVGPKYSLCLLRCIDAIARRAQDQSLFGGIDYVIESGASHQAPAEEMLARLFRSRLAQNGRLRSYSFVSKGPDHPWLFAADYLAWIWQKFDRFAEGQERDHHGDWKTPVEGLIEAKPHWPSYLSAQSVNVQALVNCSNGLIVGRIHADDAR